MSPFEPSRTTRRLDQHAPGTPAEVLRTVFGFDAFRGQQSDIIEHVLTGGNCLVLMPTGGGKSLCYQIPAVLLPGTGVVISPLIALMQDQVAALRQLGLRAACLNSTLAPAEARRVEQDLRQGGLDLVYIAPERLLQERTLSLLDRSRLALFAIDEAHCVSQWGHDFRPEYLQLNALRKRYPDVPRLACTATADARTREEIVGKLELKGRKIFVSGFDRPNIQYRVTQKRGARRQLLSFLRREHPGDAGIVYCLSRRGVDETCAFLQSEGFAALPYHAGMDKADRQRHQERFLREEGVIIVATIAFGMGIDKPDVRFVAHLDLPKSIEAYYQETGRAGRDGLPATAWMVYGLQDIVLLRRLIEGSEAEESHKRVERQRLDALLGYCEVDTCRRQVLLRYFGEEHGGLCGNCDTCLHPPETFDGTEAAQKALSCVARTGQRFGALHLIDVLRGRSTPRVAKLGHDRLPTFGVGADLDEWQWRSILRQLVARNLLRVDPRGYGGLQLTPRSRPVLRGRESVALRRDLLQGPRDDRAPAGRKPRAELPAADGPLDRSVDPALYDALRDLRLKIAAEQGVPAYVIFHDKTLAAMAAHRPQAPAELLRLSGVGAAKLERYGERFLDVIRRAAAKD
ncbi:MAG: DNA helicase RecQ [Candidatus Eisenbacteria bacterium]|nr:DNA helicase RecQ [Candidatus Eisenbacteria bacterium]